MPPMPIQHPSYDEHKPVEPLPLPEPVKSPLQRWSETAQETIGYMVLIAKATPHLVSLTWGFLMKSSTKIAAALVGLLVAVLAHFGIVIPEGLAGALDVVVALLIGWLIPAPKSNATN